MDFRTFVRILVAHWKLAAGALLACVVGAAALTVVQNKSYQSSATLLIWFSGDANLVDVYQGTLTVQERLSSYAEIDGGRAVAERAVNQLHSPIGADELVSQTHVTYTPKATLLTVTVTDTDAHRAAALAGAVADQFAAMVPTLGVGRRPAGPRPPGPAEAPQALPAAPQDASQDADGRQDSLPAQPEAARETAPGTVQETLGAQPPTTGQPTVPVAGATVVERPQISDYPVSPVPMRNMALGLFAGVILGIATALTRAAADRTVRDRDKLEELSGLPTLAELVGRGGSALRFSADGSCDDAVRSLRARLLRATGPDARRVLVTSPLGGEGTTTTALNLAQSFAESGERVLLVEGDPRRPTIAALTNIDSPVGLTTALSSPDTALEAVRATPISNLFALGSRTARRDTLPPSAFPFETLLRVLENLSAHFDRLVLDGPPVLATGDATLLAGAVHATVVVVRTGRTTVDEVKAALHALRSEGAELAGAVMTAARVAPHAKAATRAYRTKLKSAK
jgi:capsular exopolysaccharide synthesis family protein